MFNGTQTSGYQDTTITNDGFWPDLNAGDFEKRRGVPVDMDKETIAYSLAAAVAQINIELSKHKATLEGKGIKSANDAPGQPSVADKNLLIILYEKAVYSRAKADLLPEYATQQTKDAGDRVAVNETSTRESLLTESQQHIRAIKGKGRTGVALL